MTLHPSGIGRSGLLAAALLTVAALAACGAAPAGTGVLSLADPSASPNASSSPAASIDPADVMQAYAKCMRDHGADVQIATSADGGQAMTGTITGGAQAAPGSSTPPKGAQAPQGKPSAPDLQAMQEAEQACHSLLPAGGQDGPHATMDPAVMDQMLSFARCMRDHGVDFPDPKFDNGGMSVSIGGPGSNADPSSQAFQDAQKACGTALPSGGPDGKGGGFQFGTGTTSGAQP